MQDNSRETFNSASFITLKRLTVWITANYRTFLKKWQYQNILLVPQETYMVKFLETCRIKKQQLELDMEQWTVSKLEKEYNKAIYCPCLFNFHAECIIQNISLDEFYTGINIPGRTSDLQKISL